MSKCISSAGEYGEHTLDASFWCIRCYALDEDAMADELHDCRATIERVEDLIAAWQKSPDMRTRSHGDRLSEAFDGRPRE